MKISFVVQGRNDKFQNEQREECIKKGWEPLCYAAPLLIYGMGCVALIHETLKTALFWHMQQLLIKYNQKPLLNRFWSHFKLAQGDAALWLLPAATIPWNDRSYHVTTYAWYS